VITDLYTRVKETWLYLYLVIGNWRRKVVGWYASATGCCHAVVTKAKSESPQRSRVPVSSYQKGPFQAPWVIWVIRLTSPHLPN